MKKILFITLILSLVCGCDKKNNSSNKELICKSVNYDNNYVSEITVTFTSDKNGDIIKSCSNTKLTYETVEEAKKYYDTISSIYSNSQLKDNVLSYDACSIGFNEEYEEYKNIYDLKKYLESLEAECTIKDTNE